MVDRTTFITFLGRSKWAVVNSFRAVLYHADIDPCEVHLLFKSSDRERAASCVDGIHDILEVKGLDCNVHRHPVEEERDLMKPANTVEDILEEAERAVIDITPARKFMASSALIEGTRKDAVEIYYLYIDTVEDADRPYLDIPLPRQDLLEMTGGEHLVGD